MRASDHNGGTESRHKAEGSSSGGYFAGPDEVAFAAAETAREQRRMRLVGWVVAAVFFGPIVLGLLASALGWI